MCMQRKERTECTDLSLACPLPEASQSASIDTELRLRLRGDQLMTVKLTRARDRVSMSCRLLFWSASSGEKRSLEEDEGKQQKKQRTTGRDEQLLSLPPPLLDDQDEILWCESMNRDESVIEELSDESEDHHGATTEQLGQGVAKKGNERGANAHEKSLIWAAKDTEWKQLEEKGAVRILPSESAENAKGQFAKISKMPEYCVPRDLIPDDCTVVVGYCRQMHLTRDSFSTLSSLCTHHIVAQGVARRVCRKHVHPHVITCLSVCCFLVLSSSSVSRASTFSLTSTCSLFRTSTPTVSRTPSTKPNAHPQNEEYCPVAMHNRLTGHEPQAPRQLRLLRDFCRDLLE